jgi:nucleotidyltransferase substrate binding protein (TIGR01987 family)
MVVEAKLQLQLEQLSKAVATLVEALGMEPTQINKDGTIQRFEYTFELCWKTMQSAAKSSGLLDVNSPRESIRVAAQLNLIENVEIWLDFLDARNQASHVYDQATADSVYEAAKKFLPEVEKLVLKLKEWE